MAIPFLEKEISNLKIPEIDGSGTAVPVQLVQAHPRCLAGLLTSPTQPAHTPIGKIDYEVKDMAVSGLALGGSQIAPQANGVSFGLSNVGLHIHGDWHYRVSDWPHPSDSGSFDADVSGTNADVVIALLSTASGEPSVKTASCQAAVGSLKIKLHGGCVLCRAGAGATSNGACHQTHDPPPPASFSSTNPGQASCTICLTLTLPVGAAARASGDCTPTSLLTPRISSSPDALKKSLNSQLCSIVQSEIDNNLNKVLQLVLSPRHLSPPLTHFPPSHSLPPSGLPGCH